MRSWPQGHGITDLLKVVSPRDEAIGPGVCGRASGRSGRRSPSGDRPPSCSSTSGRANAAAGRDLPEPWGHLQDVALAGRPCVLMPGPYATTEQVDEGVNFLRNLVSALPVDRA